MLEFVLQICLAIYNTKLAQYALKEAVSKDQEQCKIGQDSAPECQISVL